MTEENTPQAPEPSFSDTLKAARNHGAGPNEPAQQEPAPVVSPESTPEVPPQTAPAENVVPESFTGNETAEDLNAVSKNPATHNRIRRLAQERNAANQEKARLEAEAEQMRSQLEAQRQQLELAQTAQPQTAEPWTFKEPFPEDGTVEEQEAYRLRKEAWDRDTLPALKAQAEYVSKIIAPLQREAAIRSLESEWASLQPMMDQWGTSRAELEPSVMQVLTSPGGAHRNVRSVAIDAMEQMGVFDRYAPEPGNVSVPGSGNAPPVEPPTPAPLHPDPQQAAIIEARNRAAGNKNPAALRENFRSLIKSQRTPAKRQETQ